MGRHGETTMSATIENGFRGTLVCDGLHDGPAGFQVPDAAQAGRGATLVAAFRPNRGKSMSASATVDGKAYAVISLERSRVPGFFLLLLGDV